MVLRPLWASVQPSADVDIDMNLLNPILNIDSYKLSHHLQYPAGTTGISAYIEPRGQSQMPDIVFFGLQMFLKQHLSRPVTQADIEEAEPIARLHGMPFNRAGWQRIVDRFAGYLPLQIEALPEGMLVRRGVPMVQVTNTDPESAWLTSYVETALLRAIWYPSSIATTTRRIKLALQPFVERTCDTPEETLLTRLYDFGARGTASLEQAGLGGAAHLLHFTSTDTLTGVLYAREYYGAEMAGYSIPASEHTTMTAWGQAGEQAAYDHMIDTFGAGAYSVVSDSYDIANAVSEIWGKALHDKVIAAGGSLIVRPDSGDPIDTPVQVLAQLAYAFGTSLNGKGYKVLNHNIRVLQGDGIALQDINMILGRMEAMGYAAENMIFGMGASLLQKVNRDTYSFTMKASARKDSDGVWHDIFKRPANMHEKASKSGRLAVVVEGNQLVAIRLEDLGQRENWLVPAWLNGRLVNEWSFEEARQRAAV